MCSSVTDSVTGAGLDAYLTESERAVVHGLSRRPRMCSSCYETLDQGEVHSKAMAQLAKNHFEGARRYEPVSCSGCKSTNFHYQVNDSLLNEQAVMIYHIISLNQSVLELPLAEGGIVRSEKARKDLCLLRDQGAFIPERVVDREIRDLVHQHLSREDNRALIGYQGLWPQILQKARLLHPSFSTWVAEAIALSHKLENEILVEEDARKLHQESVNHLKKLLAYDIAVDMIKRLISTGGMVGARLFLPLPANEDGRGDVPELRSDHQCPLTKLVMRQVGVLPCGHRAELRELKRFVELQSCCPTCNQFSLESEVKIDEAATVAIRNYLHMIKRSDSLDVYPISEEYGIYHSIHELAVDAGIISNSTGKVFFNPVEVNCSSRHVVERQDLSMQQTDHRHAQCPECEETVTKFRRSDEMLERIVSFSKEHLTSGEGRVELEKLDQYEIVNLNMTRFEYLQVARSSRKWTTLDAREGVARRIHLTGIRAIDSAISMILNMSALLIGFLPPLIVAFSVNFIALQALSGNIG
ncbi:MAG: hypothetical protein S4CHLAM102_04620 [Chlamydiia bacterium]|nr:hypothetical protein [Chlamydiia bacterium]